MTREVLNLRRAIDRFEQAHTRSLSPKTLRAYTDSLAVLEDFLGVDADPSTITVEDVERCLASRRFDNLTATTICGYLAAWRKFSAWGRKRFSWYDWGRDLESPRREKPQLRRLTRGEVVAMLSAPTDQRYRLVVWVLAYTGLRNGELQSLQWVHVDLVEATIRIELSKHGKGRLVPMPRVLVSFLARHKESLPEDESVDEAYLVPRVQEYTPPNGERVRVVYPLQPSGHQAVLRAAKFAARDAGVQSASEVTPHMFRRHLLEDRNEAGVPTITLADVAGHADVSTTQGYTGGSSLRAMRRLMDDLDFTSHDLSSGREA